MASAKKASASPKAAPSAHAAWPLIVSISGIRGVVGTAFTARSIAPYIDAFARMCSAENRRVVMGNDCRPSSKWIVPLAEGILRSHGIDLVYVGLQATPTVGLLVRKLRASGGIVITASHNPIEYNGLKFFSAAGEFIDAKMLERLKRLHANPELDEEPPARIGRRAHLPDDLAAEHHLEALKKALPPAKRTKNARQPKVVIDCCNSSGVSLAPDVADAYGGDVQIIHADTHKFEFPRGAEPLEENLGALKRAVVKEKADIGFALDPDSDRLAIVDEHGKALGEERTLLLAADAFLSSTKRKSPIVANLSSSRVLDDLAKNHKVAIFRTKIGEAHVVEGIKKRKARIGGEGNGGVIFPAVQPGRDAAAGIALILTGLAARGGTISEWNNSFPKYAMRKTSMPLGSISADEAFAKLRKAFPKDKIDETDGLKVVFADRWLHLRASNTEPILRLFAEAPTEADADALLERAGRALSG